MELPSQIAVGGKAGAGSEPAILHIQGQGIGYGTITWAFVAGQVRYPVCHGDKFIVDLWMGVNLIRTRPQCPLDHRGCRILYRYNLATSTQSVCGWLPRRVFWKSC